MTDEKKDLTIEATIPEQDLKEEKKDLTIEATIPEQDLWKSNQEKKVPKTYLDKALDFGRRRFLPPILGGIILILAMAPKPMYRGRGALIAVDTVQRTTYLAMRRGCCSGGKSVSQVAISFSSKEISTILEAWGKRCEKIAMGRIIAKIAPAYYRMFSSSNFYSKNQLKLLFLTPFRPINSEHVDVNLTARLIETSERRYAESLNAEHDLNIREVEFNKYKNTVPVDIMPTYYALQRKLAWNRHQRFLSSTAEQEFFVATQFHNVVADNVVADQDGMPDVEILSRNFIEDYNDIGPQTDFEAHRITELRRDVSINIIRDTYSYFD